MYSASPFTPAAGQHQPLARLYQRVSTDSGVLSASPHRLVTLLYDGLLEALNSARGALQRHDIPGKAEAVGRAVRIVNEGLKAGITHPDGSELASNMYALYIYISMRLTYANLHNDDSALQECLRLITPLRESWVAMAPQVEHGAN